MCRCAAAGRLPTLADNALSGLAAQADDDVDAGDFVTFGRDRGRADHNIFVRNVEQSVFAFDEEVMMLDGVPSSIAVVKTIAPVILRDGVIKHLPLTSGSSAGLLHL